MTVILTSCQQAVFLNNNENTNHWLRVQLLSNKKTINRFAIGAQVRVTLKDGKILSRQVESWTGQGNQNDLVLHYGLGSNNDPVDLNIFLPDGTTEILKQVQIDQRLKIETKS